jgi:hypothetical protein
VPPAWPPPPPRWHRTIRVLAAAAALVLVAGGAALLGRRTAPKADRLAREYTPAIRALGGRSLQAAALRTPTGARAGEVFLYDGAHPWCMARVDGAAGAGPLTMQLVLEDGAVVTPGRFTTAGDNASWAGDIPSTPSPITAVRIVDDTGALRYHADVDAS